MRASERVWKGLHVPALWDQPLSARSRVHLCSRTVTGGTRNRASRSPGRPFRVRTPSGRLGFRAGWRTESRKVTCRSPAVGSSKEKRKASFFFVGLFILHQSTARLRLSVVRGAEPGTPEPQARESVCRTIPPLLPPAPARLHLKLRRGDARETATREQHGPARTATHAHTPVATGPR